MKRQLFSLLILGMFMNLIAQNNSYANRMQHIFGEIDKTKVTTGYLKEFGVRFANIEACNGTLSDNNFVSKTEWYALYNSLYSMRIGTKANNMSTPQTINKEPLVDKIDNKNILIAIQHYNYQQYKPNAYTNGDVNVIDDRIYDVSGRNPYETKTLFAATVLKQNLRGNTFTFKLPSSFIHSNIDLSISQIQIDFGNGQGYQTISENQRKKITYSFGGTKEIKVKFTYTNGDAFYSHFKVWVDYLSQSEITQERFNGTRFLNENDTIWFEKEITGMAWNGSSATGRITIELAKGHTKLTKPLIVIEGFDPKNSFDYYYLINYGDLGGINVKINQPGEPEFTLNQTIEEEGYDLVFVDFANSTDYIQRNAYMVEEVIKKVNQLKVGKEKNVVLGMSMGGLIGRYALRHMELNGKTHETKLYISHDSPHQGANVPLAAQALVRHLVGEKISLPVFFSLFSINIFDLENHFPELSEGLALLESPAAQQMLIYQLQGKGSNVYINNISLHNNFLNEYKNMGYPKQGGIRNIAISNSSECGNTLGFNPYDHILDANIKVDLPYFLTYAILGSINGLSLNPLKFLSSILSTDTDLKAQFTLRALPSSQSKQIYRGRVYIKKTVLFLIDVLEPLIDENTLNSGANMLALDNTNGGIYNIDNFGELPTDFEQYLLQKRFNFIPAYSSLDIGSGKTTINSYDLSNTYSPLSPPLAPKNIPFDNFFINPKISESHTQFTLKNGNWLVDELKDTIGFFSCASACSNKLPLKINGSDQICISNSANYNIENLNENENINIIWNVSPANGFALVSDGRVATLTPNGSFTGTATLTASISTNCGTVTTSRKVQSGAYRPIKLDENGEQLATFQFSTGEYGIISFNTPPDATNWEWKKVIGNFYLMGEGNSATVLSYENTSGIIEVRAKDANCGWSAKTILIIKFKNSQSSDFLFRAYPNPAHEELNIVKVSQEKHKNSNFHKNNNSSIRLYDFKGTIVKKINSSTGRINLVGLERGRYILIIKENNYTEKHHIIIE